MIVIAPRRRDQAPRSFPRGLRAMLPQIRSRPTRFPICAARTKEKSSPKSWRMHSVRSFGSSSAVRKTSPTQARSLATPSARSAGRRVGTKLNVNDVGFAMSSATRELLSSGSIGSIRKRRMEGSVDRGSSCRTG